MLKKLRLLLYAAILGAVVQSTSADTYHHFTAMVNYPGAAVQNMPVLLRIAEGNPVGFHYADVLNNGRDFEITDSAGNTLPYEIDTWNPNGESLIWVKVPSFENGATLHVAYGRSTSDGTAHSTSVWGGYAGVWHLNDTNGMDTANVNWGNYPNSTAELGIDGMKAKMSIADEPGAIGKSVRIARNEAAWKNPSTGKIVYGGVFVPDSGESSPLDLGAEFTISGWFKYAETKIFRYDKLFFKRSTANNGSGVKGSLAMQMQGQNTPTQEICVYGSGNDSEAKTGNLGYDFFSDWKYMVFVYSNTHCSVYTNGVLATAVTITPVTDNNAPLCFGNKIDGIGDGAGENSWNGWIDEVRLADGAATAAYVAAEYAAMQPDVLSCDAVVTETHDPTTPTFASAPTFAANAYGALAFSVTVAGGIGPVMAEYTDAYTGIPVTNTVGTLTGTEAFPVTFTHVPALVNGHFYSFAAVAANASGTDCNRLTGLGTVYYGTLTVSVERNADEAWVHKAESNGVFRFSRAAGAASTALDFDVTIALTGTAIDQSTAKRAATGTVATNPAGASYVDIAIAPIYNTAVRTDTSVTLTVTSANVRAPSSATATMTVKNTSANLLERWVAADGSDENLGTSAAAPMRTPSVAVDAVKAASMTDPATVHIQPGVYPVTTTMELNAPIRVVGEGATPDDVVITNTVNSTWNGAKLRRIAALENAGAVVANITMAGGQVSGDYGAAFIINVGGGTVSNCVVRGCTLKGNSFGACWIYSPNGIVTHTVFRNIIKQGDNPGKYYDCNRGICVHLDNGGRAENCLVTDIRTPLSYPLVTLKGTLCSIRNCTFANCTLGSSLEDWTADDKGRLYTAYAAPIYADNIAAKISNVAMFGVLSTNGVALPPASSTNGVGRMLSAMSHCAMDAEPKGGLFENKGNVVTTAALAFADYANGDYTPMLDGPLFNAGADYEGKPSVDLAGNLRVRRSAIDIGCYEWSAPAGLLIRMY